MLRPNFRLIALHVCKKNDFSLVPKSQELCTVIRAKFNKCISSTLFQQVLGFCMFFEISIQHPLQDNCLKSSVDPPWEILWMMVMEDWGSRYKRKNDPNIRYAHFKASTLIYY